MTDKLSTYIWKIYEIDLGFDRIVFRAYFSREISLECYICIQVEGEPVLYSFHEEPVYPLQIETKVIQRIEVPTGTSELESRVRQFILEHPSFQALED